MEVHVSRPVLRALEEPQVLYALANILPAQQTEDTTPPPLSFCLVLDRSTSMAGERLDTARSSAENIIGQLRPQRIFSATISHRALRGTRCAAALMRKPARAGGAGPLP